MNRFKARANQHAVPDLTVMEWDHYKTSKRSPASIGINLGQSAARHSNKRLYFLALYSQHEEMKKYTTASIPEVNICPNFHSALVTLRESHNSLAINKTETNFNFTTPTQKRWTNEFIAKNPVLSLPVSKDSNHPSIAEYMVSNDKGNVTEVVKNALNLHTRKTYDEVKELCEYGSSDNYYIFENLITHSSKVGPFKASQESLKTLFKTTLFANMAILTSIKKTNSGRSIASLPHGQYGEEVMLRLKVPWTKQYFQALSK
jgi:hypothetical protein